MNGAIHELWWPAKLPVGTSRLYQCAQFCSLRQSPKPGEGRALIEKKDYDQLTELPSFRNRDDKGP
jgi:hypothetical protein